MADDISMSDIIAAMTGQNTLDEVAKAVKKGPSRPTPVAEQARAATKEEYQELLEIAVEAAEIQDEISTLLGDLPAKLKAKKEELKEKLVAFGMTQIPVPGRDAIKLVSKSDKEKTRKALVEVLGKEEGYRVWDALPVRTSSYVQIPGPRPPE